MPCLPRASRAAPSPESPSAIPVLCWIYPSASNFFCYICITSCKCVNECQCFVFVCHVSILYKTVLNRRWNRNCCILFIFSGFIDKNYSYYCWNYNDRYWLVWKIKEWQKNISVYWTTEKYWYELSRFTGYYKSRGFFQ